MDFPLGIWADVFISVWGRWGVEGCLFDDLIPNYGICVVAKLGGPGLPWLKFWFHLELVVESKNFGGFVVWGRYAQTE